MNKKEKVTKNRALGLKIWAAILAPVLILIGAAIFVYFDLYGKPLARFSTGSCPVSKVRYSVTGGDFSKFSEGYEKSKIYRAKERERKASMRAQGIAEGCSGGEIHELYYR